MPTPVMWALSAVLVIAATALAVMAVTNGLDPLILVGLVTTVGAWLVPSPIHSSTE